MVRFGNTVFNLSCIYVNFCLFVSVYLRPCVIDEFKRIIDESDILRFLPIIDFLFCFYYTLQGE